MKIIAAEPLKASFHLAIVVSEFNQDITQKLLDGALERLKELEFSEDLMTVVRVPGAVEIPITANRLAKTGRYEIIVCLGAVIRGETSHYDYVCNIVSYGCSKVSFKHNLPIIFGVLTTENEEQALARCGGAHGHKGREAIDAAMQMVSVLQQIAV